MRVFAKVIYHDQLCHGWWCFLSCVRAGNCNNHFYIKWLFDFRGVNWFIIIYFTTAVLEERIFCWCATWVLYIGYVKFLSCTNYPRNIYVKPNQNLDDDVLWQFTLCFPAIMRILSSDPYMLRLYSPSFDIFNLFRTTLNVKPFYHGTFSRKYNETNNLMDEFLLSGDYRNLPVVKTFQQSIVCVIIASSTRKHGTVSS